MRYFFILLLIPAFILAQTQSRSLNPEYQGTYTSHRWSKDRGMSWSNTWVQVGTFKKHFVCMQSIITWYDPDLEYNSIIITIFNGLTCVYIRVTEDDTIIISPIETELYLVKVMHFDKEVSRFLCTKKDKK